MSSLNVHLSNRLEELFNELSRIIECSPLPPFEREVIVVQNRGMGRYLSLKFTDRFGIWAGYDYPFPNNSIHSIIGKLFPEYTKNQPLTEHHFAWKIYELLPNLIKEDDFSVVNGYLSTASTDVARFSLSKKLASLFDHYQIYRPEIINAWEKGALASDSITERWQKRLWVEINREKKGYLIADFNERLKILLDGDASYRLNDALPQRIFIFGVSYLTPFHYNIFEALAKKCDVHAFMLSPSRDYWGEARSRKERAQLAVRQGIDEDDLYFEKGNPLLAEFGKQGREFSEFMAEREPNVIETYTEVESKTLLSVLQADILDNTDRCRGENYEPLIVGEDDKSLQIHSCHSAIRELEVLYDLLIEQFEIIKGLIPSDILVMAPNIDDFAPFIKAVFSRPFESSNGKTITLPVAVSDTRSLIDTPAASVLLSLLNLDSSRFTVTEILDLLRSIPIAMKFGFSTHDLDLIEDWVAEADVRWGRDSAHRMELCGCSVAENSWETAFNRLFAGYAMAGEETIAGFDILPCGSAFGSRATLLGQLKECFALFNESAQSLAKEKSVAEWSGHFITLCENLMIGGEKGVETGKESVIELLTQIEKEGLECSFGGKVPVSVYREAVLTRMNESRSSGGFLSGGITFCSMQPMRSIPFKVIALLGMNNGDFPRKSESTGLNLMGEKRKKGDRDIINEDRYLFLETILSARDSLIILYEGRSNKDNRPKLPSSVVSTLLETVEGITKKNSITVEHPLHSYNEKYFGDAKAKLFTYSPRMKSAVNALLSGRKLRPFVSANIAVGTEECRKIKIHELISFFHNPCRFFFTKRAGIYFPKNGFVFNPKEPFELSGLDGYRVKNEIINHFIASEKMAAEDLYSKLKAKNILPHGSVGRMEFAACLSEIRNVISKIEDLFGAGLFSCNKEKISVNINNFEFYGMLELLSNGGSFIIRPGEIRIKDRIAVLITHLFLCAEGREAFSLAIGTGKTIKKYHSVSQEKAIEALCCLAKKFEKGQITPLPFYLETATALYPKKESPLQYQAAMASFYEAPPYSGIKAAVDDPYIYLAVRHLENCDPFDAVHDEGFVKNAVEVLDILYSFEDEYGT